MEYKESSTIKQIKCFDPISDITVYNITKSKEILESKGYKLENMCLFVSKKDYEKFINTSEFFIWYTPATDIEFLQTDYVGYLITTPIVTDCLPSKYVYSINNSTIKESGLMVLFPSYP